ncbi:unnamed protein product [Fraxinus pennsylvanica]|uniref:Uncharacterized protein n=1 Tax=Fraxinus pennsylvanica TaxID=56036 RepID=A0AAD1ZKT9_9LAMI|nr:unnamed protein product [Fraxinus pennsylvanica]
MASLGRKNQSLSRSNEASDSILSRVSDSSIVRKGKSAACDAAYVAKRLMKSTGKAAWIVATSVSSWHPGFPAFHHEPLLLNMHSLTIFTPLNNFNGTSLAKEKLDLVLLVAFACLDAGLRFFTCFECMLFRLSSCRTFKRRRIFE